MHPKNLVTQYKNGSPKQYPIPASAQNFVSLNIKGKKLHANLKEKPNTCENLNSDSNMNHMS